MSNQEFPAFITVYLFDAISKEYLGESPAFQSPLEEPGIYQDPANSVRFAPDGDLAEQQEFKLNDSGDAWDIVIDLRGETYWLADGTMCTIEDIDTPLPEGALIVQPPPILTDAQVIALAATKLASVSAVANTQVSILTDATDPDIVASVNPDDVALLIMWKKYRQQLRSVDTSAIPAIFPDAPTVSA